MNGAEYCGLETRKQRYNSASELKYCLLLIVVINYLYTEGLDWNWNWIWIGEGVELIARVVRSPVI